MTESLKSLLAHQAGSVAFKPPDLNAIARDNKRRIRRRRAVTVLAAAAAVAVVASAAVALSSLANRRPDVVGPMPTGTVSWAVGSTIHNGPDTIEVGHAVRAYVRTSVGFVTVDDADNVYSVTDRGVRQIGRAAAVPKDGREFVRLFSDPHGTLAGWVGQGPSEQSGLAMLVHDQATGQTRTYEAGGSGGAVFFAIDDRTAYWRATPDRVVAVDVDTGDERQLAGADQAGNLGILSVENGVLAFDRNHQSFGNVTSLRVGRSIDDAREFPFGENAEASNVMWLSPTGAWLSFLRYQFDGPPQHDKVLTVTAQVVDTTTGDPISLSVPPGGLAVPIIWLDDTTLQVLGVDVPPGQVAAQAHLYACSVPDGTCAVAADLPAAVLDGNALVLPTGRSVS